MLLLRIFKKSLLSIRARLVCLIVFSVVIVIVYWFVFSISHVKVISLQEIPLNLVPVEGPLDLGLTTAIGGLSMCDIMPTLDNGSWPLVRENVTEKYLDDLAKETNALSGGSWTPRLCISQHKVAIVVPFRDRQSQLSSFLAHMHPFLQFQCLDYRIIVVEQTHQQPFNRGKLFNIGFKESEKLGPAHCYIFHDVDLLPLNILNIYGCTKMPRHLSANIDVYGYKLPYDWIFGGATSILKHQFISSNGFSNKFFGWGGEDDDFYNRVTRITKSICRFEPEISRYTMLSHKKESPNEDRYYYLTTGRRRFETDGLNSLRYSVKKIELKPLYTKILVEL